jgi:hypothetical protein
VNYFHVKRIHCIDKNEQKSFSRYGTAALIFSPKTHFESLPARHHSCFNDASISSQMSKERLNFLFRDFFKQLQSGKYTAELNFF